MLESLAIFVGIGIIVMAFGFLAIQIVRLRGDVGELRAEIEDRTLTDA